MPAVVVFGGVPIFLQENPSVLELTITPLADAKAETEEVEARAEEAPVTVRVYFEENCEQFARGTVVPVCSFVASFCVSVACRCMDGKVPPWCVGRVSGG